MVQHQAVVAGVAGFGIGVGTKVALDLAFPNLPSIKVTPATVSQGGSFTVEFSGFTPNSPIYGISYSTVGGPPTIFQAGVTDSMGKLTASALANMGAGVWPLVAWDQNYRCAVALLTVS